MKRSNWFQKAHTLREGEQFFLRLPSPEVHIPVFALVSFVGYTACPAVVLVRDARQTQFPCERRKLYRLREPVSASPVEI